MSAQVGTSPESYPRNTEKRYLVAEAGLLPAIYYKYRLPRWRYVVRQNLLVFVLWETPYLASMQEYLRNPLFDAYFAFTANLGTHTFFMIILPILFWLGYSAHARGVVHVLASGVFFSGFLKDLLCLPRPLSPPLQRITMSGSAALEYGFPSTHSTNAISVGLYWLLTLYSTPDIAFTSKIGLQLLVAVYTFSIVFGRLYCGMHGFLDVIVGTILGVSMAALQWVFRRDIDAYVLGDSFMPVLVIIVVILVLVRIHPEPADTCPCFDDGVAFAAVYCGVEFAVWHSSKTKWSWNQPVLETVPYSYRELGLVKSLLRLIIGIAIIFLWREVARPILRYVLSSLYQLSESIHQSFRHNYFTPASIYKQASSAPEDTLYSLDKSAICRQCSNSFGPLCTSHINKSRAYCEMHQQEVDVRTGSIRDISYPQKASGVGSFDEDGLLYRVDDHWRVLDCKNDNVDQEARELFHIKPLKPIVTYDIELVTKLVVYAGIAWWAVEGSPIIFELLGLGL
ncbi:hypothetical protein K440DRAFT_656481 [Wilcoxina mikolae CBS 423.85]|nr:hypothetical protein K440DRAFT_656481 [Wilcoxina mikolae CBS 423.85]